MSRCSICHTLVQDSEPRRTCDQCAQEYHQDCWTENNGCATYGCAAAPATAKPPLPVHQGHGWGDEKACPACGKTLASSLLLCRFCKARFPDADPMTPVEYLEHLELLARRARARRTLLLLFLLTLLGLPAPLTGAAAVALAVTRRSLLQDADGAYLALGYGTGVIGAVYACLLVAVAFGH